MTLIIATANLHKFREIRRILKNLPLKLLSLKDLDKKISVREGKKSFRDNAAKKALGLSRAYPQVLVAGEDSGLEVAALGGQPGVLSARFACLAGRRAGKNTDYRKNNRKLLRLLKGRSIRDRRARFITVIALAYKKKIIGFFEGTVKGTIAGEERGSGGFGYDPIFILPRLKKTFAELPAVQKNRISHRARAFRKLEKFLKGYIARYKECLL